MPRETLDGRHRHPPARVELAQPGAVFQRYISEVGKRTGSLTELAHALDGRRAEQELPLAGAFGNPGDCDVGVWNRPVRGPLGLLEVRRIGDFLDGWQFDTGQCFVQQRRRLITNLDEVTQKRARLSIGCY